MNERIKELKHQASLWCDKNIPEQYSEETNGYGRAWEDKFAELIVRECLEIVKLNAELYPRGGDHKSQMAVCEEYNRTFKDIKEHFGVK